MKKHHRIAIFAEGIVLGVICGPLFWRSFRGGEGTVLFDAELGVFVHMHRRGCGQGVKIGVKIGVILGVGGQNRGNLVILGVLGVYAFVHMLKHYGIRHGAINVQTRYFAF